MIRTAIPNWAFTDFQLGEFRISPNRHIVAEGGRETKVPPKVMAVLVALARQAPKVVTRESLIEGLWDGNAYVGQRAVTDAIWRLRRIFGSASDEDSLIETIPKRGYRLIEAPKPCQNANALASDPASQQSVRKPGKQGKRIISLGIILVLTGLAWFAAKRTFFRSHTLPAAAPISQRPLTHYPGKEHSPAVSPDGRILAFIRERQPGSGTVFQLDLTAPQNKPVQLGQSELNESMPAWSPGGRQLAVIRHQGQERQIAVTTLGTGQWLTLPTTKVHPFSALSWQPDGRGLIYTASTGDSGGFLAKWSFDESREIPLSQPSGKAIPIAAKFSPDGKTIALIQRNLTNFIHDLVLIENGQWRNLSHSAWDTLHFQWSPGGSAIRLTTYLNPHTLFEWRQDNPTLQPVARFELLDLTDFALGPGEALYAARSDSRGRLRAFSQNQGPTLDFTTSLGSDHSPHWSATRQQLVFISNRGGSAQLWTTDGQGQNPNCLTDFPELLWQPSWSPDSRAIAFVGWTSGTNHHDLYLLELETGATRQITADDYHYMGIPSWRANGKSVLVGRMKDSVWRLCSIEIASRQVTDLPIEAFFAQETEDGAGLYYCRNGKKGLWYRDWTTGRETRVLDAAILESQWVMASNQIFLVIDGPNTLQFAEYNLTAKALMMGRALPKDFLWHNRLTYITESKTFVYGGLASNERDIFKVILPTHLAAKPNP